MRVSTKLAAGFAIVLGIAVAVGVLGILGMRNLRESGHHMYEERVLGLEYVHGAVAAYGQMLLSGREVVTDSLYDDRKGAIDHQEEFEKKAAAFISIMHRSMEIADTVELLEFHVRVLDQVENHYLPAARRINEMSIADIPDHHERLFINVQIASLAETTGNIEGLLAGLVALNAALAEQVNSDNAWLTQIFIIWQILLLLVAVVTVLVVAYVIIHSIAVPISESVGVLRSIAGGDFAARVTGNYKGDFETIKNSVNDTGAQLSLYLDGKMAAERAAHEAELTKNRIEAEAKETMAEEMRKAQVAEESSRAKGNFLATMSHEIRTPMNAILGITEIHLQDEGLEPKYKDAFDKIYNSSDLLLGIINDLLDMSKIEAGKLELVPVKYETASMISDIVTINLMRFSSTRLQFKLAVDENIPATLFGDELRIKQVMNNLISNAFKYTKEGEVRFSVTSEAGAAPELTDAVNEAKAGDHPFVTLVFVVSDSGRGMSEEQVSRLFEEYSRFDMVANRNTEGTGLGMSITRNLLKMMGGEIAVESAVGVGTTITVRLQQQNVGKDVLGKELVQNLVHNREGTASVKRTQIVSEPMPYGSVLIVDDVAMNIYVAKGLMAPYELKIDSADNGHEVIALINSGKVYDIIFMDYMMPEMDGVEVTGILRGKGYDKPIIALTADAIAGREDMFLECGFDGFLSKPIDIRLLDITLKKYIRDKYPHEAAETAKMVKTVKTEGGAPEAAALEAPVAAAAPTGPLTFMEALGRIACLDVALGLSRFAGNEKIYQDVLRMFHRRLPDEVAALTDFIATENIKGFRVAVHGLKSQLATAGAMAIADTAQDLENAAKGENIAYCRAHFTAFSEELLALHASLNGVILPAEAPAVAADSAAADLTDEQSGAATALFEKLGPMLKVGDTACMSLIEEVRAIPGTGELLEQMEMIDFTRAYATLLRLKEEMK